ncbi:hypothetical protein B7463_g10690, partial [Scytalidium lignicola]
MSFVHPTTTTSTSTTTVTPIPTSTSTSVVAPVPTTSSTCPAPTVPTPVVTTCSTTGVYTFPATTVTLTESTTVCGAATTAVPSGTHTVGGVTTVVETATTVVCPYATVSTSSGVVTSIILTTTYVCPAAGTYTIAPITTTCTESTVLVYPTPASYSPGVYTQPELTTTITETNFVYVCPFTSSAEALPTTVASTTTSVAPPPPPPTSSAAAPPPAPKSSAPAKAVASASTSASALVPVSSSSSSSSGLGGKVPGKPWAITYTPYSGTGACKTEEQVESDIQTIASKGFSVVRVYSTDCSTLEFVGAACEKYGLKIILGVFIQTTIEAAKPQVDQIIAWGKWELVELVVIGNEAIFNGLCTASELASFISSCSASFKSAGYSGPCTTTEPLNIWQENSGALCGVVDKVGCNIHAFFNADTVPELAGAFVASELALVNALCPGKSGINLECGWPSAGTCNGKACPGPTEQATAIKSIVATVGESSVLFSYTDDTWKPKGDFDCEQSWGLIQLF